MDEVVVLDAVAIAAAAQDARVRAGGSSDAARAVLLTYAAELDDIAEAAVALDQHENEIDHQLRWWADRAAALESELTGNPADDVDLVRELALYRGRISGAHTMRRHYAQQRNALVARQRLADRTCAEGLAEA